MAVFLLFSVGISNISRYRFVFEKERDRFGGILCIRPALDQQSCRAERSVIGLALAGVRLSLLCYFLAASTCAVGSDLIFLPYSPPFK